MVYRWLRSLGPKEPLNKKQASLFFQRIRDLAQALPSLYPVYMDTTAKEVKGTLETSVFAPEIMQAPLRVAVEFGEGSGLIIPRSAELAGARLVTYSGFKAKGKVSDIEGFAYTSSLTD